MNQSNGHRRQCACGHPPRSAADTFRWGFGCGFKDALRIAAREINDPHVWAVLDRIADQYELVGGDA